MGKLVEQAKAWIAEQAVSGRDSRDSETHVPQSSCPDAPAPYIGQVVQVESMEGQRVLVVIAFVLEDDPRLPIGRWLGVAGTNDHRWVRERLVVEWQPHCRTCRGQRWWWTPELVVFCAICQPPTPNWRQAFEELADWTDGIRPDDPRLPAMLAAVDGCDTAWLAKDWGRFQRHMFEVQWLVLRMSQPAEGGTHAQ